MTPVKIRHSSICVLPQRCILTGLMSRICLEPTDDIIVKLLQTQFSQRCVLCISRTWRQGREPTCKLSIAIIHNFGIRLVQHVGTAIDSTEPRKSLQPISQITECQAVKKVASSFLNRNLSEGRHQAIVTAARMLCRSISCLIASEQLPAAVLQGRTRGRYRVLCLLQSGARSYCTAGS